MPVVRRGRQVIRCGNLFEPSGNKGGSLSVCGLIPPIPGRSLDCARDDVPGAWECQFCEGSLRFCRVLWVHLVDGFGSVAWGDAIRRGPRSGSASSEHICSTSYGRSGGSAISTIPVPESATVVGLSGVSVLCVIVRAPSRSASSPGAKVTVTSRLDPAATS